ncbi:MAG: D-glycero-beta-D-manno-heptose 1,7-bisphosphate 7-phosphatase [Leptospirales bacterium]|nr:D-glycero-beta-D-manno-heptose 1,7-bisphosphate 7-phosphatase [Leptospirales bacterium]
MKPVRLAILDRDGTINLDSPNAILKLEEFELLPGAATAIAALSQSGILVAVATNQAAIGRGRTTAAEVEKMHAKLRSEAHAAGGKIDWIMICPHRPEDQCQCRKPAPGMLLELLMRAEVTPQAAVMIGDSLRDLEAAQAAGIRALLVRSGNGAELEATGGARLAAGIFDDLDAACRQVLQENE